MKERLIAMVVVAALGSPPAIAADLAVKAPVAAPVWNWTGFYLGANVGGGIGFVHLDDPGVFFSSATPAGGFFTGGAQAGYNYQIGNGLVGIEADVNGNSALKGTVIGGRNQFALRAGFDADVSGTIRARAGVAMNNTLLYVTGGAAWANFAQSGVVFDNRQQKASFGQPTGVTANASAMLWGGVIGAGVEYALDRQWTIGGEFLHIMYADRGASFLNADGTSLCVDVSAANCALRSQLKTDVARLRLNYRFGGEPAVAQALAWVPAAKEKTAASIYNWTGFYVGGNAGGGMAVSHFTDPGFYGSTTTPAGGFFSGGLQVGYNYQFGNGVVGLEADVNGNSALRKSVIGGFGDLAMVAGVVTDVSGTIRARAGVTVNNALLYVTGGAAWANFRQTGVDTVLLATANAAGVLWGGVIGAGVEYALSPNWTVGGEFLHTVYGDRAASFQVNAASVCGSDFPSSNCVIRSQLTTDVARVKLNYRFGDQGDPSAALRPQAIAHNWTGFYVGGNVGGGMAATAFTDPGFYSSSATPTSGYFTGGAQAGYNYQFGKGLVGVEVDIVGNSAFKNTVIGGNTFNTMAVGGKADISGTIRARSGFVVNNALLYVTGGAAWAKFSQSGVELDNFALSPTFGQPTGVTANARATLWGGVIGAGVEYALSPNWTIGGEFLHTMYRDLDADLLSARGTSFCEVAPPTNCVIRSQLTTDVLRLRLNYRLGG